MISVDPLRSKRIADIPLGNLVARVFREELEYGLRVDYEDWKTVLGLNVPIDTSQRSNLLFDPVSQPHLDLGAPIFTIEPDSIQINGQIPSVGHMVATHEFVAMSGWAGNRYNATTEYWNIRTGLHVQPNDLHRATFFTRWKVGVRDVNGTLQVLVSSP